MSLYSGNSLLAGVLSASDGLSAYEQAKLGGYTGTEAEFNALLGSLKSSLDSKAPSSHNQSASTITEGTAAGKIVANPTAVASLGVAQVRNIYAGTADMVAGSSPLATGDIYLVYE